jgi:hypothetical protein
MKTRYRLLIRKTLNFGLLLIVILAYMGSKGARCGNGNYNPQIIANGFVESDRMISTSNPDIEWFKDELKTANYNRNLTIWLDEVCEYVYEFDLQQYPGTLSSYLYNYRTIVDTINTTVYPIRFYMCGVSKIKNASGNPLAGVCFCSDALEGEARIAIAYIEIRDQCVANDKLLELGQHHKWITAHEIGHAFDLAHCDSLYCFMDGDWNVEESIKKRFCTPHRSDIGSNIP